MPPLTRRLDLLAAVPSPAATAVLLNALQRAVPVERDPIAIAALRAGPAAAAEILRRLDQLGPTVLEAAAKGGPAVSAALRDVVRAGQPDELIRAFDLIVRRGEFAAAPAVASLIGTDRDVSRRAAAVLRDLTLAAIGPRGRGLPSPTDARALDRAVATAVRADEARRQPDLMLAVALLSRRPGPELAAWLNEADHPGHFSLRAIVGRMEQPLVRRNMVEWLDDERLAPQVLRRLPEIRGPQAWADVLESGHLLRTPGRRRAIRRAARPRGYRPDLATAIALPAAAQRRLPALLRVLNIPIDDTAARLGELVTLPDAAARLLAMTALAAFEAAAAHRATVPFIFDESPAVRGIASARLSRHPATPPDVLTQIAGGDTPAAGRAAVRLAREDTAALFDQWLALPALDVVIAARRRLAVDARAFLAGLSTALSSHDRDRRLRAISVARRVGVVPTVELDLILLASSPDHHVASAAVAALGAAPSDSAHQTLRAATRHPDGRVRANAVEALDDRLTDPDVDRLRPIAVGSHARARANAVRSLVRHRPSEGTAFLDRMLQDDDPRHRISGLWVARRCDPSVAMAEVRRLAGTDTDASVRRRASQVAGFLSMRTSTPTARERIA